ncbi:hypothetical protein K1T35_45720 [Pseudonocardia sp. DSM 110487]|uniref:hypothetical protein n=1 Tax=Pseudonocardia sp. DSM 110487 TaxID=2865833 RepID=UPI001C69D626|nr:hypothetical protein [Pseudonocardia sp. DSM 110487]QYN35522.1 hypothetical protein K1T35_45720 [Pseudonocardia sp. DSM 110487]
MITTEALATGPANVTGVTVLAELAALLDRYPGRDCPPAAMRELLDEVAGVLRWARAAVRRATREVEPVGKPAPANAELRPEKQPAPKQVAPAATPRPPTSSASADRPAPATPPAQPDSPTVADPVTSATSSPTTEQRTAADTPARPAPVLTTPQRQGLGSVLPAVATRRRSRWLPLLVGALLAIVVLLALLVQHPAVLAAAAVPAAIYAATVYRAKRPSTRSAGRPAT